MAWCRAPGHVVAANCTVVAHAPLLVTYPQLNLMEFCLCTISPFLFFYIIIHVIIHIVLKLDTNILRNKSGYMYNQKYTFGIRTLISTMDLLVTLDNRYLWKRLEHSMDPWTILSIRVCIKSVILSNNISIIKPITVLFPITSASRKVTVNKNY